MAWRADHDYWTGTGKPFWPQPKAKTWGARLSHLWRWVITWNGWTYRPFASWFLYVQMVTLLLCLYGLLSANVNRIVQGHDRVAHSIGFGFWALLLYPSWQPVQTNRMPPSRANQISQRLKLTSFVCLAAATASEALQWLARARTGRTFSFADLMADLFGTVVGLLLATLSHLGYITCLDRDSLHRQEEMDAWHI